MPAMVREERSASRLITAVVVCAIVGAVLGVVVQHYVLRDTEGGTTGGIAGAIVGALLATLSVMARDRRAEEAARTAPVDVPWPLTVDLARRAFRDRESGLAWKR